MSFSFNHSHSTSNHTYMCTVHTACSSFFSTVTHQWKLSNSVCEATKSECIKVTRKMSSSVWLTGEHKLTVHLVRLQSRNQVPVHLNQRHLGLLVLVKDQLGCDGTQLILDRNYLVKNPTNKRIIKAIYQWQNCDTQSFLPFICCRNVQRSKLITTVRVYCTSLQSSICCSLSAKRLRLSSSSLRASWVSARRFTSSMILRIFLRPLGVLLLSLFSSFASSWSLCSNQEQSKMTKGHGRICFLPGFSSRYQMSREGLKEDRRIKQQLLPFHCWSQTPKCRELVSSGRNYKLLLFRLDLIWCKEEAGQKLVFIAYCSHP